MLRIKESIAYAKENGMIDKQGVKDLYKDLWEDSNPHSARMNFNNLTNGKSKKIDIVSVPIICKRLGVSADYLFGLSDVETTSPVKEELTEKAQELLETINKL